MLFLHYLVYLDEDTLAKQIVCAQKEYNVPGFVSEGRELLRIFNLPNIVDESIAVTKFQWKTMVKKAVHLNFEEMIKGKISAHADGGPRSPSAHSGPFARPPISMSGNFLAHVSAESPSNISPNPSEVISEVSEP